MRIDIISTCFLVQNIERSIRKGIAEKILLDDLSATTLHGMLDKLLTDESYARNMKQCSDLFHDQKETPLERAVWWVEWSLRHPNATNFDGVGRQLNRFQLQSLDVIIVILICVLIVIYGVWSVGKIVFRLIFGGSRKKTKVE